MIAGRVRVTPFRLPLRRPLATARGPVTWRDGLLLRLETPDGTCGWGEATPAAGFGDAKRVLAAARDTARLDVAARRAGRSLAEHLRVSEAGEGRELAEPRLHLRVGCLLGVDGGSDDALAAAASEALAAGHRTLKLKLDGRDPGRALARVERLRKVVGSGPRIRVDAGGSFTEDAALRAALRLADLDVELWEEPVRPGDLAALARVRRLGALPIAADESAASPAHAMAVLDAEAADVLVLKPSLMGVANALFVAQRARERGVATLVTSALDGAVGRATALAVAAVLPGPPEPAYDSGLGTDALLADDLAPEPASRGGALELPRGPGLGVVPDPAAVERLRSGPVLEPRP